MIAFFNYWNRKHTIFKINSLEFYIFKFTSRKTTISENESNINSENTVPVEINDATDVINKERAKKMQSMDRYDPAIYDMGLNWGNEGLSLDDAPLEVKNNSNFINGFNKAKRLQLIAELDQSQSGPKR